MLKIYITRHGQNEDNANGILNGHRDLPLTEIGISQAYKLAKGIKEARLMFDTIYTSPLSRAFKTAEVICKTLGTPPPIKNKYLIERDFGIMSGEPASNIETLCSPDIIKTNTITYFLSPEGAETFPILLERAKVTLSQIQSKHTDGSILLVTHGDFGKMMYAAFYNIEWLDVLTKFHFGNCELLLLSKCTDPHTPHVIHIDQYNH